MKYEFLIGFLVASVILANWWFAMFSDSGPGQMARAMNKMNRRGKNVIALFFPGFGLGGALIMLMKLLHDLGAPSEVAKGFGAVGALVVAVSLLGFLPFRLPGWMYPEYHLARRERVRAEKLARGEAVKMPSSGPAAVEAQRLEQALRAQERQGESGK